MVKILLVDDEPDMETLIRRRFRKQVDQGHFEIVYAINGVDALEKLKQHSDTTIVLTDINMPEMDGLTLLLKLNEMNSKVKAVIISAYGDMDNIRTAMNRGAFDFITKPINFDDLSLTIDKTIKFVHQQEENMRMLVENNRMSEELRIANTVQRKLLPSIRPNISGLDVFAVNLPAMEIGGDYYDFLYHDDYDLGIVIADVAGKGTSAAFYMAEIKGIMHAFSKTFTSPKELFKQANKILRSHLSKNVFITAACGMFKLKKQSFLFARAGHCPALHYSVRSNQFNSFEPKGMGLGMDSGNLFDTVLEEIEIPFSAGDIFVFFTDGLCEIENGSHEEYDSLRMQQTILIHKNLPSEGLGSKIMADAKAFAKDSILHDDLTLVIVKII